MCKTANGELPVVKGQQIDQPGELYSGIAKPGEVTAE
jgi:hypothetical protein